MLVAMLWALFGWMSFIVAACMEEQDTRQRLTCIGGIFLGIGVLIAIANLL